MPCHCEKKNSQFVGKYVGKYRRTIIDSSAEPSQTTECGILKMEITQPDPCNKCAHLITLSYVPCDATGDYEEQPIAIFGPLNAEDSIHAVDLEIDDDNNSASVTNHQIRLLGEHKLEHTLSTKSVNGSQIWTTECNKVKRVKDEPKCGCH